MLRGWTGFLSTQLNTGHLSPAETWTPFRSGAQVRTERLRPSAFQGAVHGRGDAVAVQGCSLAAFVMSADGPDGERAASPIGTARVELNREHLIADGYEVSAFVPTGSYDDGCLATLAESSFAVWGTTLYCGVREVDGVAGLFIHIFLPTPPPAENPAVFGVNVYQPYAQGYGEPVLYTGG